MNFYQQVRTTTVTTINNNSKLGYRQLNQTDKKPTGEFNRDSLLEYLEEQARSQPEIEDYVPHIPGQKKGKIYK